jgi:hypothetical protein
VFLVLADFHTYNDWWPPSIRFWLEAAGPAMVGTRIRISSDMLVRWVAEVTSIEANRRIGFHYVTGAWEGDAAWTLAPEADGTRVSYAVDMVPVQSWLRLLGRFLDFGAMHSTRIQGVLGNLRTHPRLAGPATGEDDRLA